MIRLLIVLTWAIFLFLLSCTESLEQLLLKGELIFIMQSPPSLSEFWLPLPSMMESSFIVRKIGHGLAFFVLALLVFHCCNSKIKTFLLSFTYAAFTEIAQLFFNRGGRLFDIAFDGMGIIPALIMISILKMSNKKSLAKTSQT